jgi:DegV family protein with EDD domain
MSRCPKLNGEIFTDLVGKEDVLILVCASSRISQVVAIAGRAAQKVSPLQVAIHDSGGVSLWQGFQAVRAAQMAAAGQDGEAILGSLGRMRRQSQFLCVLDTLAFLHKGGRVNLAQYMISLVFDIKPILSIKDGEIVPVGRARGRERALVEMQFRLLESMRGLLSVWVGVVYTGASDSAQRYASQMENPARLVLCWRGPGRQSPYGGLRDQRSAHEAAGPVSTGTQGCEQQPPRLKPPSGSAGTAADRNRARG